MFDTEIDIAIAIRYKDLEDAEKQEENIKIRKIILARRKADQRAQAQYDFEHSHGYCPHCFGLIALNGRCMNGCDD